MEKAKREAARRAVDEYITQKNMSIGIGSGSTILYSIQRLAERVHGEEKLQIAGCVPTSFQSRVFCANAGLPLSEPSMFPELDVVIDGADEVDRDLNLIKGGGACQTQEKIVAACGRQFIVVADSRKCSNGLLSVWKKGVPIEVLPFAYSMVFERLKKLGGVPKLRMAEPNKAGPVVTDNGGFVIDCDFPELAVTGKEADGGRTGLLNYGNKQLWQEDKNAEASEASEKLVGPMTPAELHSVIKGMVGVVETGIFPATMVTKAYFGKEDGSVETWNKPSQ